MLKPLDYILDFDNNFWIICYIQDNMVYGKKIFKACDSGNRYNESQKILYEKLTSEAIIPIPGSFKKHYDPNTFYIQNKKNLNGIWEIFVSELNKIGICDESIGIFGSYLLGFPISKDIDFIIYGMDNLKKYHDNIKLIRECTGTRPITLQHIEYQYYKYRNLYNSKTDIRSIISRNWSGLQIGLGALSTPRFIINNDPIPSCVGNDQVISCEVISGLISACYPRQAKVLLNGDIYTILTPFWMYQSFAKDGDHLLVCGDINHDTKTILLLNSNHWIQFI